MRMRIRHVIGLAGLLCAHAPVMAQQGLSKSQAKHLREAHAIAESVLRDTLFQEVIRRMDSSGAIVWDPARLSYLPVQGRMRPTAWVLEQFTTRGLFHLDSISATWSPVAGIGNTVGGAERSKFSRWKFEKDPFSLANTIVHERTHTFCVHIRSHRTWQTTCATPVMSSGPRLKPWRATGPVSADCSPAASPCAPDCAKYSRI